MSMMSLLCSYVTIYLNLEQNIETSGKILSIIGKKKRIARNKIGESKSKIDLSLIIISL